MADMEEIKPLSNSYGFGFGEDWLGDMDDSLDFDEKSKDDRHETAPDMASPASGGADHLDEMEIIDISDDDFANGNDIELGDDLFESMPEMDMEIEVNMDSSNPAFTEVSVPDAENAHVEETAETSSPEDEPDAGPQPQETPENEEVSAADEPDEPDEPEDDSDQEIEVTLDAEDIPPDMSASIPDTEPQDGGRAVTAQTLDIDALRREVEKRNEHPSGEINKADPLKDPQLWQFVSLIMMHLFDDLELLILQKETDEACDLMKQINRLSNILCFAGLGEHLPLLAYISTFLPISFTDVAIGEHSERKFDPLKVRRFAEKSNELLNCLAYLLGCLSKRAVGFDQSRYMDSLESLYRALKLTPGKPSNDAPLALTDDVNPHELTSRTIAKLSRTLEALITESLHYIESAVSYNYSSGYTDAAKSLNMAAQIAREYKLEDIEANVGQIFICVKDCRASDPMPPEALDNYVKLCDLMQTHFYNQINEKKIRHLRAILSKFCPTAAKEADVPFSIRWKSFFQQATPLFEFDKIRYSDFRQRGQAIAELAGAHGIEWIKKTLDHLDHLWDNFETSCAEALLALVRELSGFPADEIEEADIEQLNHERLQVLFARKRDAKPMSAYAFVRNAQQLANLLPQNLENPALISTAKIQDLLIDARQVQCHAVARTCEVLLTLLERIPRNTDNPNAVTDAVANALYFTTELLQTICARLTVDLEQTPTAPSVTSRHLFYHVISTLYQIPGQPRDSVTWFINKRLTQLLSELQLVWSNASTPTSTEYYCTLIRKLIHLTTICEMNDARRMLSAHLEEIPKQDFINTDNLSMKRACTRIIRAIEDTSPEITPLPNPDQIHLFFAKLITAFNQILSSQDVNKPEEIRAEILMIESRLHALGMTTNFPSILAILFELHQLAYIENIDRKVIEDFLYELINVANNVAPDWNQPRDTDLEFVRTAIPIPMPIYQDIIDAVTIVREALVVHRHEEPVAWERIDSLYNTVHYLTGYLPNSLQMVVMNAQNRCRYLKKNITVELDTNGYPMPDDVPKDSVRAIISLAFLTIIEKLVEMIIDNAFTTTNNDSRITIVLHPFIHELSAAVLHNGSHLTMDDFLDQLLRVNIMPAPDENVLDLLVSSKQLAVSYPPVNAIAYILPILRQFDGTLEPASDKTGQMRFSLDFKI